MREIDIKDLKGWTRRLSKREIKHLRDDAFVRTTAQLKETLEYAVDQHDKGDLYCYECYQIAVKLGVIE